VDELSSVARFLLTGEPLAKFNERDAFRLH
jgi:hypothetical protein